MSCQACDLFAPGMAQQCVLVLKVRSTLLSWLLLARHNQMPGLCISTLMHLAQNLYRLLHTTPDACQTATASDTKVDQAWSHSHCGTPADVCIHQQAAQSMQASNHFFKTF